MMMFQRGCLLVFYLLLVAVFQLCIQKVQSDRLPEVNDLNRERKQRKRGVGCGGVVVWWGGGWVGNISQ